ncbi:hypothetical protein [Streptomyces sp. NPDC058664]|uniref:hypothetical protein n=1 Tax=unclassified Streptomyces TaxID=2593676 RepID=UPI0036658222
MNDRDGLKEPAAWPEAEYGPVTEAEPAAARAELAGFDAEHERRRAASAVHGLPDLGLPDLDNVDIEEVLKRRGTAE